jgi:hypothetical protein
LPSNGMGKKGDLISVKNDTPHEQKQTSAWSNNVYNKFWEELIAYFALIRHRPHKKPKTYGGQRQ